MVKAKLGRRNSMRGIEFVTFQPSIITKAMFRQGRKTVNPEQTENREYWLRVVDSILDQFLDKSSFPLICS